MPQNYHVLSGYDFRGGDIESRDCPDLDQAVRLAVNLINGDPMKAKQLAKGIDQLMDEGVAQLFTLDLNGRKVIGTVGALQFEVIQYRLEHEYGAKCSYENLNVHKACWVETPETSHPEFLDFTRVKAKFLAKDKQGQQVFLADSAFSLQMTKDKYPALQFHATSEF